jgi:tetratricopeptide (TPR) repeat protein
MRVLRWLAACVVAALAGYAVYGLAWRPFRCNVVTKRVQTMAEDIFELPTTMTVVMEARQGIAEMQRCIASCPTDVDAYMTVAAHDRVIGRLQHAAAMYSEALKYDRRPELFFNLGIVEYELNQSDAALGALTKACTFSIEYADDIPDPNLRQAVLSAVRAQQERAIAEGARK